MRQTNAPAEPDDLIGPRTAASIIGISTTALHKIDDVLRPRRDHLGRRVYRRAAIDAYSGARDVKRVALARRRAQAERERAAALTDRAQVEALKDRASRRERLAALIEERGR